MKPYDWNTLREADFNRYRKAYLDFMYEKANAFKCSECPENRGMRSTDQVGPCGQQNCWVNCHCKGVTDDDDG